MAARSEQFFTQRVRIIFLDKLLKWYLYRAGLAVCSELGDDDDALLCRLSPVNQ